MRERWIACAIDSGPLWREHSRTAPPASRALASGRREQDDGPMKALITGGAGFIGSHIAERLVLEGHDVRIFDNLTSGKRANLTAFAANVDFVEADIRDAVKLDYYAAGCDVVFHQAAIVSVPYSVEHPQETH